MVKLFRKTAVIAILVAAITVIFSSCGGPPPSEPPSEVTATEDTTEDESAEEVEAEEIYEGDYYFHDRVTKYAKDLGVWPSEVIFSAGTFEGKRWDRAAIIITGKVAYHSWKPDKGTLYLKIAGTEYTGHEGKFFRLVCKNDDPGSPLIIGVDWTDGCKIFKPPYPNLNGKHIRVVIGFGYLPDDHQSDDEVPDLTPELYKLAPNPYIDIENTGWDFEGIFAKDYPNPTYFRYGDGGPDPENDGTHRGPNTVPSLVDW